MSEKQKMLDGHLYQPYSEELYKDREYCKGMLFEYNHLHPFDKEHRDFILKKLLKCQGELCIEQPFYCSYGYNIHIGVNFYSDINLTILDNESKLLFYKENTPIQITGFNSIETNPNYTLLSNMVDNTDTTNYYKIVLTHEPDSIDNFTLYKPNLVLSGHSLGGLIKIPFLKPLFLQDNSKNYYEDYYNINETKLFVSSGLGTSGINARFNNFPSFNLYRLYKTKESN